MERTYNCHDFRFKRHLTLEQAEKMKEQWEHSKDDERRIARILFKKKTNDYTVRLSRDYNE